MRHLILISFFLVSFSTANAGNEELLGVYTNPVYGNAYVEIRKSTKGLELLFNIHCDSKTFAKVFHISLDNSNIAGKLELSDEGHGQCFTGSNPSFIVLGNGNIIRIKTNPRVETPGFNGIYELRKNWQN